MFRMTPSRRRLGGAFAVAAVSAVAMGAASSASAAVPTGIYSDFSKCPVSNPNTSYCLYSKSTSGSFTLGNATVPINKPVILQGGYHVDDNFNTTFINAQGGDTLVKTPLKVPGGLSGLMLPTSFGGPLLTLLLDAINSVNDVTATAELAGPVNFNFLNFVSASGTAIELPIRVKLENPFLGDSCYVGSTSNPVRLKLTTGSTTPPPPNTSISGTLGDLSYDDDSNLVINSNNKLVGNDFSVPAASDCGPFLFKWAVTPVVNLKEGFPSAAGKNAAILQGGVTKLGNVVSVRASSH